MILFRNETGGIVSSSREAGGNLFSGNNELLKYANQLQLLPRHVPTKQTRTKQPKWENNQPAKHATSPHPRGLTVGWSIFA